MLYRVISVRKERHVELIKTNHLRSESMVKDWVQPFCLEERISNNTALLNL